MLITEARKNEAFVIDSFFSVFIQRLLWCYRYFLAISLLVSHKKKCFCYNISFGEHEKVCVYIALEFQTSLICVPVSGNLHIEYTVRCLDINREEKDCFQDSTCIPPGKS